MGISQKDTTTTNEVRVREHGQSGQWDHSTHDRFFEYYAQESASEEALGRMRRLRDRILAMTGNTDAKRKLTVADLGCGAGTDSMVWAEFGHEVHALDVNEPLVDLGRKRAATAGYDIDFRVGSATDTPWSDESMDVCVALELLEHVTDWEKCLQEMMRLLRPGGAMFFTTTNRLCPLQAEFNLPLYSWYPSFLKRHYVKLAMSTRPDLANYARYPAFHWFTFYGLRKYLKRRGFRCFDRFDIMDLSNKTAMQRFIIALVRSVPPIRFMAHVATGGTIMLAVKSAQ